MHALQPRDLPLALTRGLTLTLIAAPALIAVGDALAPRLEGLPGVTSLLVVQLAGALCAVTTVVAALAATRRQRPQRLDAGERGELVGLGILLGFAAGAAAMQTTSAPPSVTLSLAALAALAGGCLTGALLWRGDAYAGALLGWVTASLGLLTALGTSVFGGALIHVAAPTWGPELSQLALGSLVLAGCYLGSLRAAAAISAVDPLVAHSLLERP